MSPWLVVEHWITLGLDFNKISLDWEDRAP